MKKLWKNTVDLFRSMDIPVRTLECCSGDLADLKVKSVDVEAWSPRQQKYFEVGSCSNLGDAQARRLGIRVKGADGKYFAHTLNNTVVAPPRMLIAFLENNLQADGSVKIPEALRPYMGGNAVIEPKKLRSNMHQYLKAIGFGPIKKKAELKEILEQTRETFTHQMTVSYNEEADYCEFQKEYGQDVGITLCGELDDHDQFDMEYYFPYFQGSGVTTYADVSIEKPNRARTVRRNL